MTTFAAPAVIDALVTALQPLKSASPKAFVLDGPLRQWPKSDAVVVGIGRSEGASLKLPLEERLGGFVGYQERVEVTCATYSWVEPTDSPTEIKARRDRAMALFQAVDAALAASPTLGGVCERAYLGDDVAVIPANDGDGPRVTIGFTVVAVKTAYRAP